MGTMVTLSFTGAIADEPAGHAALVAAVRQLVVEIEDELSRFRPESDISRLNRRPGEWLAVGPHTAAVLAEAARLRAQTQGLFDPALPGRGIGVRRRAAEGSAGTAVMVAEARLAAGGDSRDRRRGIDLGGIGKGYAADACLALCRQFSAASALVAVGVSSLAVMGERPGGGPWRVGIRAPGAGRDQVLGVIDLADGALATSSLDEQAAHIIDPRTGRPCDSDILQATVLADSGMVAEAYSTALLVGGTSCAARWPVDSVTVTAEAVLVSAGARASFRPRLHQ
ncbi:MAG: FAD:protein FMN transferase [Bifidobacteriaceae bacterium]|jgi:thiamine biosynthesis lipoprotein|nr:FAD:protein FMN transferase [Bifidobacteriaceae bacterium]